MDELVISLETIGFAQMVLGWVFVACYALALGGMLGPKGSLRAGAAAALASLLFCLFSANWVHGALLILFAIGGMAGFVIAAWALTLGATCLLQRKHAALATPSPDAAQPLIAAHPVQALRNSWRTHLTP